VKQAKRTTRASGGIKLAKRDVHAFRDHFGTILQGADSAARLKHADLQAFLDAGGGTRTPDTRIMIGSLEPKIPGFTGPFV
jgi:hypothetical protein